MHTQHTHSKFGFCCAVVAEFEIEFSATKKSLILNGVLLDLIALVLVDHSKI